MSYTQPGRGPDVTRENNVQNPEIPGCFLIYFDEHIPPFNRLFIITFKLIISELAVLQAPDAHEPALAAPINAAAEI